jgi:sulfotransferase family protein
MPTLTKLIARHETVKRRAAVPAYRAVARVAVFLPGPRVFANSFPKAGTHLLSTLLGELPRMMFSGVHRSEGDYVDGEARRDGSNLDWARLRRTLERVNKGQYATGHFPYVPGLPELLDELGYRSLVMIRDPRDVVVSAQHYVQEMSGHDLHRRFSERYTTADERIAATITGFDADEYGRGQASIGDRLERFVPWLTTPGVRVVRFEDLIGAAGGGSREAQERAVADIARHAGRELDPARVAAIADRVWSDRSSTFRQGRAGGWRERLTPEHVRLFKEHAGRALIELGYESDLDW